MLMRFTLTLDNDVAKEIRELARQSGGSVDGVVNSVLRKGLARGASASGNARFEVTPKSCGFQGGVDVRRLNQLSDELEAEEFLRESGVGEIDF